MLVPEASVSTWNGILKSGRARTGAKESAALKALVWFWIIDETYY
jgi:hypothetical protein